MVRGWGSERLPSVSSGCLSDATARSLPLSHSPTRVLAAAPVSMTIQELRHAAKLDCDDCGLRDLVVARPEERAEARLFLTATPTRAIWDETSHCRILQGDCSRASS